MKETPTRTCAPTGDPAHEIHLDERALAARLGVSVKWLQKKRYTGGGIPFRKFGRAVRYPLDAVITYEAQALRTSTSDPGDQRPPLNGFEEVPHD